jgi:hypothetical protein
MPELATGNGVSTARCIRPGGRRAKALTVRAVGGPSKYGSLKINEWLQPRECFPQKAVQGADPLDPKGRPMLDGKKRTSAPTSRGGVGTQAPIQGSQR